MNLGKTQPSEPPRIFISHAWEDKTLVRRLEAALKAAEAEVWVDHVGVRGGDNLPERISEALDWCDTLVLVWSKAAAGSRWVKLEWTNAIALDKLIIPCPSDNTPLPSILAHKAYIDFSEAERGVRELLRALQLTPPASRPAQDAVVPTHSPVIQTPPIRKTSPKQPAPSTASPRYSLRATKRDNLSEAEVKTMLREKNFYSMDAYDWSQAWSNPQGQGLPNDFEVQQSGKVIFDRATDLMWQQGGSSEYMTYEKAQAYIAQLNRDRFAGFNDWRLPTLEEAMSLMKPKKSGDLYIDPKFDAKQSWIWTADALSASAAWVAGFYLGYCDPDGVGSYYFVRAVRSGQ